MTYADENTHVVCWTRPMVPLRADATDLPCEICPAEGFDPAVLSTWQPLCQEGEFTLVVMRAVPIEMGYKALQRMVAIARDTGAVMVYSDHYVRQEQGGALRRFPLIDYQAGSLRDDFDFGALVMFRTDALREALNELADDMADGRDLELSRIDYGAFYGLRLALSRMGELVHVPEALYTTVQPPQRPSGDRIYDYQAASSAPAQREMEALCTWHLKHIGAYLPAGQYTDVDVTCHDFAVECTVVIPVLNRARVIGDAIESVLSQQAPFDFNLIVVDNHSTDGTTEVIDRYAAHPRLIHIVPDRDDLGIGGCWNKAIYDARCGRFAIGLDSDDLFATPYALRTMVEKFYETRAAMVVGSYKTVDEHLHEVAPGVIAHREWTDANGRNNLLHVNGIGGPRAFYTPLYRSICLPGSSYGEDYGMALMVSRHYRVGRVWDVMTLARRWNDNTDSDLDINRENANNFYKDRLRTWEVMARMQMNSSRYTE